MSRADMRSVFLIMLVSVVLFVFGFCLSVQPFVLFPVKRAHSLQHVFHEKYAAVSKHGNSNTQRTDHACSAVKPREHLVFIKTHKTGSTTLTHIINRFGYTRNLSFTLNRGRPRDGHMDHISVTPNTRRCFLPPLKWHGTNGSVNSSSLSSSANFSYDILNIHIRHNKAGIDAFMAQPTRYITILRDPGYQVESVFAFFGVHRNLLPVDRELCSQQQLVCLLGHYLAKPEFYRNHTRGWQRNMIDNGQIFDLGLNQDRHRNSSAVDEYLSRLEAEMDLVLITEYFDESLLLLRRLMCWDWADILYLPKNVRSNHQEIPEKFRHSMRKFNAVDMRLYEHFNKSLWDKIHEYGPSFKSELAHFRAMLNRTAQLCTKGTKSGGGKGFHKIFAHKIRKNASTECTLIAESFSALKKKVLNRQKLVSGESRFTK